KVSNVCKTNNGSATASSSESLISERFSLSSAASDWGANSFLFLPPVDARHILDLGSQPASSDTTCQTQQGGPMNRGRSVALVLTCTVALLASLAPMSHASAADPSLEGPITTGNGPFFVGSTTFDVGS